MNKTFTYFVAYAHRPPFSVVNQFNNMVFTLNEAVDSAKTIRAITSRIVKDTRHSNVTIIGISRLT